MTFVLLWKICLTSNNLTNHGINILKFKIIVKISSMDQFVTTYRRDFLWPYTKSFGRSRIEYEDHPNLAQKCECECFHPKKSILTGGTDKDLQWSRLGPMGPLLDPKLYPVKVGKSPESNIMRQDQPNRFLNKLQEKYPFLYEIIKSTPPSDLIARVNKDRYNTTYQIDYCSEESLPDYLARAEGVGGSAPCPEPTRLPGDPHRANQRPRAFKSSGISKCAQEQKSQSKTCNEGGGGLGVWTFSKSEYTDGISRLGGIIIREKLHYHSSRRN